MRHLFLASIMMISISSFSQWTKNHLKARNEQQIYWQQVPFDKPEEAIQFEIEKTKDPHTQQVPKDRLRFAMDYTKSLSMQKSAIDDVIWTERGPNNVGGRTRAIMFDPNYTNNHKVWAAGITGGLWYNTDALNNGQWQNVNDFWDNIAVSTLASDPSNTTVFYAGTGEGWTSKSVRGLGIWISTNSGQTWSQISSTNNDMFYNVQKIIVTETGRVLAATSYGLMVSDNHGTNWTTLMEGYFGDIEKAGNGYLYASLGKNGTEGFIYKSINNGNTWTDITPQFSVQERIELAVAPSNPLKIYAVASVGTAVSWMASSDNAGTSWQELNIPMYLEQSCSPSTYYDYTRGQAWYDLILAVHPQDEDVLYAGGIDWHMSMDGGNSWEAVSYWTGGCLPYVHADQHIFAFVPNDASKMLVGCDGGVFLIEDADTYDWTTNHLNNGYNVTQFYGTAIENESGSNYMLAGAQDNGTHRFNTSGLGNTVRVTGGDGGFCFIDQANSQYQITSYVYNNWRLSTNGGNSFSYYPSTSDGYFINPADYDSEEKVLYASTRKDSIYVSRILVDGADGEYLPISGGLNSGRISAVKVSPFQTDVIFVGTSYGDVFKIINAQDAPSSTNLDPNQQLPSAYISSVELGSSENQILVTYSNYGISSVWETRNGGTTWSNIEHNLPDMPIRWGLYNPENTNQIMLATETGVWSIDDITTQTIWEPVNTGLANVRCDQIKYRTSDKMVAVATYGRGLFTTDAFADPQPVAVFEASQTVACLTDTIYLIDHSTKNPTQWLWSISPSNFTYVLGTNAESQNPIIVFQNAGLYSISLTATNGSGSGSVTEENYLEINNECRYVMDDDDDLYLCSGTFFDPGYTENYPSGSDYTITIYPENENSFIELSFLYFDLEYESDCNYDYLSIYDGASTAAPLIGKFCGSESPGYVSGINNLDGALTFKFHSDDYVEGLGWEAQISCSLVDHVDSKESNQFSIIPNPANQSIELSYIDKSVENIKIYNMLGKLIQQEYIDNHQNQKVDVSDLDEGIYIVTVGTRNQKLVIKR
ncbi:MAG: T9SS type A sorting domain-containing protein [Bacteroidales bacterium]|nr:T9SS type A sorting domain-containing protein [Bacteroidales bacterium]